MRQHDYRWLLVFGGNLLLLWLAGLANHYLAAANLHLYVGGLLVTFAALRLDLKHGFTSTVLTAFAADALAPVPYGTSLVLLGLVHAVLYYGRQRFPREEVVFAIFVTLVSNLFLFLALSFLLVGRNPHPAAAWMRLFADLVFSQVVLGLATSWFMALQEHAFALLRLHPETGRRVAA